MKQNQSVIIGLKMMSELGSTNGSVKPHTTVTVTTDQGATPGSIEIRLNIGYFKTTPGWIKIIQLVIGIVCMACGAPANVLRGVDNFGLGHNHFFLFVVVTTFIISLIWVFFYLLQIRDYIKVKLPFTFMKLEIIFTILATIFYFIAFIVILSGYGWCTTSNTRGSSLCDAKVTAGVFGIFNTIAYGIGAYLLFRDFNSTPPELQ